MTKKMKIKVNKPKKEEKTYTLSEIREIYSIFNKSGKDVKELPKEKEEE